MIRCCLFNCRRAGMELLIQNNKFLEEWRKRMEKTIWWKEPMRVLQYNLQVRDTPLIDAKKLAQQTEDLAANVVVMNVGGIYAWYRSEVPYHHVNEYLPGGQDLLAELIGEFHQKDIRFIGRFDFSITEDTTFLQKPQWFARKQNREPYFRGERRMGNWSLFLNTCALGGYRNEEVGIPVIKEVLAKYDIDGIFFNAPHASVCFCERCRRKYQELYGKEMPEQEDEFETDWLSECMKMNIGNIYRTIKSVREDVPMILYYAPFTTLSKSFGRNNRDSIYDRYMTADLICTESQNILSHGVCNLPDTIHPVMAMKSGQLPDREKLPFGIIHSCPGMDWRHVGMPTAEYLPWMCQVPASGGTLWHSVTGFPDTIHDKRVLEAVRKVNEWIKRTESGMRGADYRSDVLLLWDGQAASKGWAEVLVKTHLQFDLMHDYAVDISRFGRYPLIVIPNGLKTDVAVGEALRIYMEKGGRVLMECPAAKDAARWHELTGIKKEVFQSEYLTASYLKPETAGAMLLGGMDTDKLAFRGEVAYCTPEEGTEVLATLIPPFAPYEVVGAPPERASLPVEQTGLPLVLRKRYGGGNIVLLPFSAAKLVQDYHLEDHYRFLENIMTDQLGDRINFYSEAPRDVQITVYEKKGSILIHLVNEIGQRPLLENLPVYAISMKLRLKDGQHILGADSAIAGARVIYSEKDSIAEIRLERLEVWDMIEVHVSQRDQTDQGAGKGILSIKRINSDSPAAV